MSTQTIVDLLNSPPFELDLTLVTLDEKSPLELVQLLNTVFAEISSEHANIDLRDEQPDATAERMLQFLRILNFRTALTFEEMRSALISGDTSFIYSALEWTLTNLLSLKKRAYVAKFLAPIAVPEECFTDEMFNETYEQYKSLQAEFVNVHRNYEKVKATAVQPAELKKEIAQLVMEKEQLQTKIGKKRATLESLSNLDELLAAVSKYRKEQEEEIRLQERKMEQMQIYEQSGVRVQMARKKLNDLQSASRDEDATALLQRLEEDTEYTRVMCEEKLPADIALKQSRARTVQLILDSPPVNESKLSSISSDIKQLQAEVAGLIEKQSKMPGDDKLAMFKAQATSVAKKKQELLDQMKILEEEKAQLESELNEKQQEFAAKAGFKMTKDELKKFTEEARAKQASCKEKKAMLSDVQAEQGILQRTAEILKTRCKNLAETMASIESSKGIAGYTSTQSELEGVSATTSQINIAKGASLEVISKLATEIIAEIKDKKTKLAPQIKELREVRAKSNELESTWQEKKQIYDNAAVELEAEKSKLETQLTSYLTEIVREEGKYHMTNCMSALLDAKKNRVQSGSGAGGGRSLGGAGGDFQALKDLYNSKIQQQENRSKSLREEQKTTKESHESSVRQVKMFRDLKKLLHVKVQSAKANAMGGGEQVGGAGAGGAGVDVFVMSE